MSPFAHPRPGRLALASALVALALGAAGCDAPSAMGEADSLILIISNDLWAPSEETAYATLETTVRTTRDDKKFFVHRVEPDAPEIPELLLWKQVIVVAAPGDDRLEQILAAAGDTATTGGRVVQAEDVWARGQAATAVVLEADAELDSWLALLPDLADTIDRDYRAYVLNRMYVSGPDSANARALAERYGYSLRYPAVYETVELADQVVLIRNDNPDPNELIRSILVERRPASDSLSAAELLAWRELAARTHYNVPQGTTTDDSVGTVLDLNGTAGLEVRGVWQDEGTFPAAGLFIARQMRCPNATVFIDAWLYSPNPKRSKYEYIIQLEEILNSFSCEAGS